VWGWGLWEGGIMGQTRGCNHKPRRGGGGGRDEFLFYFIVSVLPSNSAIDNVIYNCLFYKEQSQISLTLKLDTCEQCGIFQALFTTTITTTTNNNNNNNNNEMGWACGAYG